MHKHKEYTNIFIELPEELHEFAGAMLLGMPYTGFESKHDVLIISFPSEEVTDEIKEIILSQMLRLHFNSRIIKTESIYEKNWNEEWENNIEPIIVNERIIITPTWKKNEVQCKYKIIIDPKMSFGTGHHATTRLICRLIEPNVKENQFVIDAGTGTGVLAILAIFLGASKVLAFDNNIWAIENAKENFELNNVSDRIELLESDIDLIELPSADIITANLYTHLLLPNMENFYNCLKEKKGSLFVSGILVFDSHEVIEKATSVGFSLVKEEIEEEWVAYHFKIRDKI